MGGASEKPVSKPGRIKAVVRRSTGAAAEPPAATPVSTPSPGSEPPAIEKLRQLHAEAAAAQFEASAAARKSDPQIADVRTHLTEPSPGKQNAAAVREASPNEREAGLMAMLRIEGEAREARTSLELLTLIANAPRRLTRARQIFLVRKVLGSWRTLAVSALPTVDRTTPLIRFIEQIAERLSSEGHDVKTREFHVSAYAGPDDETGRTYPMQEALWVPFVDRDGGVFAGMLLTREQSWQEADIVVANRLAGAFQHAMLALDGRRPLWQRIRPSRSVRLALAAAVVSLGFMPVSLTTLAPAEVVARDPFILAAPIDGVIDDIPISPNTPVERDALLVKLDDTMLRNKFEIAEREVLVAEARLKTTTQLAFADERGRHDLAVARADLLLKTAERDFAREMLAKTEIRAPRAGLAVFSDKKALIGKPMAVGERILEIADPGKVELRIEVPVDDAIILRDDARVKVLLDADPLSAIEARIVHSDYQARPSDANVLSFRAVAELVGQDKPPRLGGRGSAQIYGDRVPLAFFLLRRPFAKLRQWTGQ